MKGLGVGPRTVMQVLMWGEATKSPEQPGVNSRAWMGV